MPKATVTFGGEIPPETLTAICALLAEIGRPLADEPWPDRDTGRTALSFDPGEQEEEPEGPAYETQLMTLIREQSPIVVSSHSDNQFDLGLERLVRELQRRPGIWVRHFVPPSHNRAGWLDLGTITLWKPGEQQPISCYCDWEGRPMISAFRPAGMGDDAYRSLVVQQALDAEEARNATIPPLKLT